MPARSARECLATWSGAVGRTRLEVQWSHALWYPQGWNVLVFTTPAAVASVKGAEEHVLQDRNNGNVGHVEYRAPTCAAVRRAGNNHNSYWDAATERTIFIRPQEKPQSLVR